MNHQENENQNPIFEEEEKTDPRPVEEEQSAWEKKEHDSSGFASFTEPPRNEGVPVNTNSPYGWQQPYYSQQPYTPHFRKDFSESPLGKPPRKKRGAAVVVIALCLVFSIGILSIVALLASDTLNFNELFGSFSSSQAQGDSSENAQNTGSATLDLNNRPDNTNTTNEQGILNTVEIAAKLKPSVVGVSLYQSSLYNTPISSGSGIIMTSDGYIITNAHVVSGGDSIEVQLDDGEQLAAKLIGMDLRTDLAVIKIEKTGLSAAKFGNSDQLKVGEDVVAIGNPSGLYGTVTKGIISKVDGTITTESGSIISILQTDAAINPGNSGGPLIDMYGNIVGINSAKIAQVGVENIGFAIPISKAKPIIDELIKYTYVRNRVRLGVLFQPISQTQAEYNNLPMGILVISLDKNCDIYNKGILANDIITKIDGISIKGSEDVLKILENKKPNDKVTLTVFRRSRPNKDTTFDVSVTLSEDKGTTDFDE